MRRSTARDWLARTRDWALDHPALSVLLVALVVRAFLAIALTATVGMEEFPDTRGYNLLASERASGAFHDWSADTEYFYDRLGGYVLPLAGLYRIFGDHLFLGQMLAAILGALTAGTVCRLILEVTTPRWALFGGLIVALFPSQVLWSSVAFKDSAVWLACSAMALFALRAGRARGWRLAGYGLFLAGLLFWLGHLRLPTCIVAAWALVVAALFSAPAGRFARLAGATAVLLIVPWYLGLGLGGVDYVRDYSSPRAVRVRLAENAGTAVVDETGGGASELAYLPRGLSVVLLEPLPWTRFHGYEVRLAQAELLVWYPLLVVGIVGIPTLIRKRRELAFVAVTSGAILVTYALYEGNFGTALRHRSELVPGLAVLAALGAPVLLTWWRRRTAPDQVATAGQATGVIEARGR